MKKEMTGQKQGPPLDNRILGDVIIDFNSVSYNFGIRSQYYVNSSSMKNKDHKESRFLKKIKDSSLQQTDRKACFSGPRTDSCMMEFLEALERYFLRGIRQQVSAKAVWSLQNVEEDVADLSEVERQLHMSYSSSKLLINICSEQKLDNSPPKKDGNLITALSNTKNSVEINLNDLCI